MKKRRELPTPVPGPGPPAVGPYYMAPPVDLYTLGGTHLCTLPVSREGLVGNLLKTITWYLKMHLKMHQLGTGQRYEMVCKEVRMEHDKPLSDYLDPRGNNRVVLLIVSDDPRKK